MKNPGKLIVLIFCSIHLSAQPYFDAVTLRGAISPDGGLWRTNYAPVKYQQYVAGVVLPLVFKKDSSKLIIGAFTERWEIEAADIPDIPKAVQGMLFPVSFIKPVSGKWSIAGTVIPRWNGNATDMFENSFQFGVSVLAAYKRTPDLTYRFGVYYNTEFFGPFIIPLLGIDWKISRKDNLFGILPQILTYEHRVSDRFSWGAAYRMFNNSYRAGYVNLSSSPTYLRINEMQLMLSADLYVTKKIALNIEAGHSMFRRLRMGEDVAKKDYYSDEKVNDGFILKAGLLYRIRLR